MYAITWELQNQDTLSKIHPNIKQKYNNQRIIFYSTTWNTQWVFYRNLCDYNKIFIFYLSVMYLLLYTVPILFSCTFAWIWKYTLQNFYIIRRLNPIWKHMDTGHTWALNFHKKINGDCELWFWTPHARNTFTGERRGCWCTCSSDVERNWISCA